MASDLGQMFPFCTVVCLHFVPEFDKVSPGSAPMAEYVWITMYLL